MQSEIAHLREALARRDTQIDQQNKLLAVATQQNGQLLNQLEPPRVSLGEQLSQWVAKFQSP